VGMRIDDAGTEPEALGIHFDAAPPDLWADLDDPAVRDGNAAVEGRRARSVVDARVCDG